MANVIKMPLLSDTMEEGTIAEILVKEGDQISSGDILAEVETDKATMEVEAYDEHEGTLLYIAKAGDAVPVGGVLAITGEKGEDIQNLLSGGSAEKSQKKSKPTEEKESDNQEKETEVSEAADEEISMENISLIKMPLLSDTMEQGIIAGVLVNEGDKVKSGDIIAEVETDKATMEVEAYDEHEGVLAYVAKEGDAVPVGGVLAITAKEGTNVDVDAILKSVSSGGSKKQTKKQSPEKKEETKTSEVRDSSPASTSSDNGRIKASPLAKKMAKEEGLDLNKISGSGDKGRIVKKDIEAALESGTAKAGAAPDKQTAPEQKSGFVSVVPTGEEQFDEIKVTQMRKTIAKRLGESKFGAPHFYLTMEVNMDKMMIARKEMNELSPVKISFNDLVMKAAAMALRQHPDVNSSWLGDTIRVNKHVHIGMAVAIDTGLVVPVIKFADSMPLSQMAAASRELAGKARDGKLGLDEMQGSTFSVSNLGSMGIEEFTAIINPPNAAILAVGGINRRMRDVNGEMKAVNVMKVTLSCDHRVVDGAVGSAYLNTFKQYIENPTLMLV